MRPALDKLLRAGLCSAALCSAQLSSAQANDSANTPQRVPLSAQCLKEVANSYAIHPDVLLAILIVEGGTVGQNSGQNDNGSYDIGLFQINTIHRGVLSEMGITEAELRNNGCTNAAVAAWQLRRVFPVDMESSITSADDYLRAIARYHSVTPQYNEIYARKLGKAFDLIYANEGYGNE